MDNIIGKVIEKANTDEFVFVSNKHFQTSYVAVLMEHISEHSKIIGEIVTKQAINPYFEKPTTINYIDDRDESIKTQSLYMVTVKPLALIRGGHAREVKFPPLPGSNVLEAEDIDIRNALNLPEEGVDIGNLEASRNLRVKISPYQLLKTHIAILGQTGSGKSYMASKIALELFKLRRSADVPQEIPIPIILDSSGEYSGVYNLGEQKCLAEVMKTIDIKEHAFPLLNEKYLPLLYEIYDINEKQESELRIWLDSGIGDIITKEAKENSRLLFASEESGQLIAQFRQLRINSTKQFANCLEEYMKQFNKLKVTEKTHIPYNAISKMRKLNIKIKRSDDVDFTEMLSRGLIVNLSEQNSYEERQIAILLLLRQIYEAKRTKRLDLKLVFFIDEAHNYVPSIYKSFCKDEILKLAREGRKYGISLCLISQRPRWVDPTALSQCGSIFIFRIQNSDDKKHIFDSASLPDTARAINIGGFKTGEMIITGDVVGHTIRCLVSEIDTNYIATERRKIAERYTSEIKKL